MERGIHAVEKARAIVNILGPIRHCEDSAVAERFVLSIKAVLIDDALFARRVEARSAIAEHIEHFVDIARRHPRRGYFSPVEFEL